MARPRMVSDEEILDAARKVFLEHGPHVSTKVIADAVGLSPPALFKRFGTKDRLMLDSLIPQGEPPFIKLIHEGPDQRDVRVQLIEIGVAMSRFFDLVLPCLMTLRAGGERTVDQMFMEMDEPPPLRVKAALTAWFHRAEELGHIKVENAGAMALAFIGGLQSGAFLAHLTTTPRDDAHIERIVTGLVATLYRGMTPEN